MIVANISLGYIDLPETTTLNIFAQGCTHQCEGCSNLSLQNPLSSNAFCLSDNDFINELIRVKPITNWICWLGGDATSQSQRLSELTQIAKSHGFYSCLYTGFKYDSECIQTILKRSSIDILIDGKWKGIMVTEEHTNQQIYVKVAEDQYNNVTWYNGELLNEIKRFKNHRS